MLVLVLLMLKSEISTNPVSAKGAGGKTGKVNKKKFRPSDVKMDEDFMMNGNNEDAMYKGQLAKYQQNDELKKMLLLMLWSITMHLT